jgi:hypothetical protein
MKKILVMIVAAPADIRTRNLPTASHKPKHRSAYYNITRTKRLTDTLSAVGLTGRINTDRFHKRH